VSSDVVNPVPESFEPDEADLATAPIEARAITYSRSLLRIKVPVKVTLASKKQPIGRIIELGPGAIIHFEKSCEEMLDLEIGGQTVAQGEPVKVGEKFGIRLTSLTLPHERFLTLAARDKG
jgi:flagellar motor switch/type III secretory pathway protein FliN